MASDTTERKRPQIGQRGGQRVSPADEPIGAELSWKAAGPNRIAREGSREEGARAPRTVEDDARTRIEGHGRAIAVYNPYHPSVLFDALRRGLLAHASASRLGRTLRQWLTRPKASGERRASSAGIKRRIIGKDKGRFLLDSGLIIPNQNDVFLLTRPGAGEDYVIEQRARSRARLKD